MGCDAEHYIIFLTGKDNFRDKRATMYPYKGNRTGEKPEHHAAIRQYMIDYHGAVVVDGAEADDALGIFATEKETGVEKVICTLDKDLNMIPGLHYNWRNDTLFNVTPKEAEEFFIEQLLTGDSTDNIPGLYKLTDQKATKKIKARCTSKDSFMECIQEVFMVYAEALKKVDLACHPPIGYLDEIGDLLWIQRDDAKTWRDYRKSTLPVTSLEVLRHELTEAKKIFEECTKEIAKGKSKTNKEESS